METADGYAEQTIPNVNYPKQGLPQRIIFIFTHTYTPFTVTGLVFQTLLNGTSDGYAQTIPNVNHPCQG